MINTSINVYFEKRVYSKLNYEKLMFELIDEKKYLHFLMISYLNI